MSNLEHKSVRDNKAIVRRFVRVAQSQGQLSAIDEYLSSQFIDHSAPAGLPNDREGVKLQFAMLRSAFPDMQAVIHDQVSGNDKVVTRKSLRGTHLGDFLGIAPSRQSHLARSH